MRKTLYTSSAIWQGPYDNEKVVYLCGITQKVFENLRLEDSFDENYTEYTAFKLVGTSDNDLSRIYKPYSSDNLVVTNIDNTTTFGIDDNNNYIIFPEGYFESKSEYQNVRVKLIRNYASIYKSNLASFDFVNDFEDLQEKAITSIVVSENGLYLAGVSGKVWFYDGFVIKGPVFSCYDAEFLPISSMIKHKFYHESEDYLYVATDNKPRLFRSKLSTAKDGNDWEEVYASGELAASTGGILCMASAFNKIFMGCRESKVLIYSRTNSKVLSSPVDMITEAVVETDTPVETLTTSTIISNNINDFEPLSIDIKAIEVSRDQVLVGLSNKGEIWSYTETTQNNPNLIENWVSYKFDEVFATDPSPAQYYSYDNKTLSRNDSNIATSKTYDETSNNYIESSVVIKGNTLTGSGVTTEGSRFFEIAQGSDWEQALSNNLPDQNFINVKCATTTSLNSLLNQSSIDGYTLQPFDLVMVKDQVSGSSISNGIYRLEYGTLVRYNALGLNDNSTTIGFYIENGYVNGKNRYLLTTSNFLSDNFSIYKPKYTLDFELRNLAYSSATACTNLSNCTFLNQLKDNDERISSSTGYTGYQGIEIADLYGIFDLKFNTSNIKLSSGNNEVTYSLPTYGTYKNWRFSSSSGATTDGWEANEFVSAMIGTTEAAYDQANNQYTRYMLRITPSSTGNPSIVFSDLNIDVDSQADFKIRCKVDPLSNFGFNESKINLYWSYDNYEFSNKSSALLNSNTGYYEYIISPVWKGSVKNIKLEFENLPDTAYQNYASRPTYIYIDYIKIENEDLSFDMNSQMSKIRITVEDRDIKVYLGKQEYPYIDVKNFIQLDNWNRKYVDIDYYSDKYNNPYIRFGKIQNDYGNSLFAYSSLSFIVGESYAPKTQKIIDFSHSQKLPASGGVRLFSYHDGTIYCMTDGFDSNKVNDNPDDRQAKIFAYKPDSQSWIPENITFERKKVFNSDGTYNLYGIVRPISAISYKGSLYMSGQYGNIKVV